MSNIFKKPVKPAKNTQPPTPWYDEIDDDLIRMAEELSNDPDFIAELMQDFPELQTAKTNKVYAEGEYTVSDDGIFRDAATGEQLKPGDLVRIIQRTPIGTFAPVESFGNEIVTQNTFIVDDAQMETVALIRIALF